MEAIKFNVEQDFQVFVTLPEAVSDGKFMITLFAGGAKYSAVYDGESYKNCRRINDTTIVVLVDNHHLKCGEVDVEIRLEIPDESMPDGNFKYVTRKPVTISVDGVDKTLFLHHGESESLELASVNFEILELALFYGFFTSEEDLPKPTRAGYAYVGAINEFVVYVTNARTWHNSGVKASSITEDVKAEADLAHEMAMLASQKADSANRAAENAELVVENLRTSLSNFMTTQGEDIRGAILLMQKVGDTVEKMGLEAKEQGENAASQGASAENSALMADEATKKATDAATLATEKANLANNKARFADEQGEAAKLAAQSANTAAGNAQNVADKVDEEWEQKSEEWNEQISTAVLTSSTISAYAEKVNAQLSGSTITITNRNGESRTFELPTVEDSLESEDASKALSANQGKVLKEAVDFLAMALENAGKLIDKQDEKIGKIDRSTFKVYNVEDINENNLEIPSSESFTLRLDGVQASHSLMINAIFQLLRFDCFYHALDVDENNNITAKPYVCTVMSQSAGPWKFYAVVQYDQGSKEFIAEPAPAFESSWNETMEELCIDVFKSMLHNITLEERVGDQEEKLTELRREVDEMEGTDAETIAEHLPVPDYNGNAVPTRFGQPWELYGAGAPQEAVVPDNWKQFDMETGEGCNWNGLPIFIGQRYINVLATTRALYIAVRTSYDKNNDNYWSLKWLNI